ncbi:MAG TPA: hypothetical protein VN875_09135 [Candidatus Binatus sp.]|nr:hypothetical protein [Candidatus Binatus sp.]
MQPIWRQFGHSIAILLFTALTASAAQAQTTQTNCNLNGNTANCTSTTTPTYDGGAAMAKAGKDVGDAASGWAQVIRANRARKQEKIAAAQAIHAEIQARQDALDNEKAAYAAQVASAKVNIVYCQQNSAGSVTTGQGVKACPELLGYAKALCTVNPKESICDTLAAVAVPDTLDKYGVAAEKP